jgi:hypothetical protein
LTPVYIEDLWIDEANEAKMNSHGIGANEALSVLDLDKFEVFANPSKDPEAAPLVIVGPSSVRPFVTMPIDETSLDGVYRPRTAYKSGRQQINEYRRRRPE